MPRLPQPGGDNGNWGEILNDFLSQSLASDGTIKAGAVTKNDLGLGNVNNTSDTDKPISDAVQAALDTKLDITDLDDGVAAQLNEGSSASYAALDAVISAATADIDGRSAYQIAVDAGFSGTESQWLASLKGEVGEQGEAGTPGDLTDASAYSNIFGPQTLYAGMLPSTHVWFLSGDVTVNLDSGFPSDKSGTITLVLKQAATGGPWNVTWPTQIQWPNGVPGPAVPTAANAELITHLFWTGLGWRGVIAAVFFP